MKQLTCEMCGSTDLMKQDGVFVCQTCGCKYSVEEAKKMMVEGTVDVAGTVAIDNSEMLSNLCKMAWMKFNSGDRIGTEQLLDEIFKIDFGVVDAWLLKLELLLDDLSISVLNDSECSQAEIAIKKFYAEAGRNMSQNDFETFTTKAEVLVRTRILWAVEEKPDDVDRFTRNIEDQVRFYTQEGITTERVFNELIDHVLMKIELRVEWIENALKLLDNLFGHEEWTWIPELTEEAIKAIAYEYIIKLYSLYKNKESVDKIMEYHKKWNEIDPSHVIPERPEEIKLKVETPAPKKRGLFGFTK